KKFRQMADSLYMLPRLSTPEFNCSGKTLDNRIVQICNLLLLSAEFLSLKFHHMAESFSCRKEFHNTFYPSPYKIRNNRFFYNVHGSQLVSPAHTLFR